MAKTLPNPYITFIAPVTWVARYLLSQVIEEEDGSMEGHSQTFSRRKQLLTRDQIRRSRGSSAWHCPVCRDTRTLDGPTKPPHTTSYTSMPPSSSRAGSGGFLVSDSSPSWSFTKIPPSLAARPTCFSVSSEGGQGNGNILVSPPSSSPRNCAALASHATCALLITTMSKGTRQIYLSETIWNNRNYQHTNSN